MNPLLKTRLLGAAGVFLLSAGCEKFPVPGGEPPGTRADVLAETRAELAEARDALERQAMEMETRSALMDKELAELQQALKEQENASLRASLATLEAQNEELREQARIARKKSQELARNLAPASAPQPVAEVEPVARVTLDSIRSHESLAPHGRWIEVTGYGPCWRPSAVGASWRPYLDGCWEWTEFGWTWRSNEPFGAVVYHYGRWMQLSRHGWVWVPGCDWAPAWVSWRQGRNHVGWAPLPPERGAWHGIYRDCDTRYRLGPSSYVFVSLHRFVQPSYRTHCVPVVQNTTIFQTSVNVTQIVRQDHARIGPVFVHHGGPIRSQVEEACAVAIPETEVRSILPEEGSQESDGTVGDGNQADLLVERPSETPGDGPGLPEIVDRIEDPEVVDGFAGVPTDAVEEIRDTLAEEERMATRQQASEGEGVMFAAGGEGTNERESASPADAAAPLASMAEPSGGALAGDSGTSVDPGASGAEEGTGTPRLGSEAGPQSVPVAAVIGESAPAPAAAEIPVPLATSEPGSGVTGKEIAMEDGARAAEETDPARGIEAPLPTVVAREIRVQPKADRSEGSRESGDRTGDPGESAAMPRSGAVPQEGPPERTNILSGPVADSERLANAEEARGPGAERGSEERTERSVDLPTLRAVEIQEVPVGRRSAELRSATVGSEGRGMPEASETREKDLASRGNEEPMGRAQDTTRELEQPVAEEANRRNQEAAMQASREEAGREAEEANRRAQEAAMQASREEAGREAEEANRRAQEAAMQAAREEAGREAEEANRRNQEAAMQAAREEARREAEEANRRAQEAAMQAAREEARREAEEANRRAQEAAMRAAQEEARREAEEANRRAQEAAMRAAQEEARREAEEANRRAQEAAMRAAQEEARREAEEANRRAQEAAMREAQEEARRAAQEEARRAAQEEANRRAREAAEKEAPRADP